MSLKNDILTFIKECADEKNIKMFKAGARAGNDTLLSLVDDIHHISKLVISSRKGVGLAFLNEVFPRTAETIQRNQDKITRLHTELYPQLPEEDITYEGTVKGISMDTDEPGNYGYLVTLNMSPEFDFFVYNPEIKSLHDKYPKTILAKCLNLESGAWQIVPSEKAMFVRSYVA